MNDPLDAWGVAVHNGAKLVSVLVGWNDDAIGEVCAKLQRDRPEGAEDYSISPVRIGVITDPESGSIFGGELIETVEVVAISPERLLDLLDGAE